MHEIRPFVGDCNFIVSVPVHAAQPYTPKFKLATVALYREIDAFARS